MVAECHKQAVWLNAEPCVAFAAPIPSDKDLGPQFVATLAFACRRWTHLGIYGVVSESQAVRSPRVLRTKYGFYKVPVIQV